MKNLLVLAFVCFSVVFWTGCDKPELSGSSNGDVVLSFKANHGNEPFVLNEVYQDFLGHRIRVEQFRSYFSEIALVKANGEEVRLVDLVLINFGVDNEITLRVPTGKYTSLRVGMGVPEALNKDQDPSEYQESHPLSVSGSQGMFWHWNTGYIFTKYEGKSDLTGTDGAPMDDSFAYHVGEDALYRDKYFEGDFKVKPSGVLKLELEIDCYKLFVSETTSIDISTEPLSHTSGNFQLAERFVNLMESALELR